MHRICFKYCNYNCKYKLIDIVEDSELLLYKAVTSDTEQYLAILLSIRNNAAIISGNLSYVYATWGAVFDLNDRIDDSMCISDTITQNGWLYVH